MQKRDTERRKLRSACVHEIHEQRGMFPRKVILERIDGSCYTALFTYGRGTVLAEIPNRHAANLHVELTQNINGRI